MDQEIKKGRVFVVVFPWNHNFALNVWSMCRNLLLRVILPSGFSLFFFYRPWACVYVCEHVSLFNHFELFFIQLIFFFRDRIISTTIQWDAATFVYLCIMRCCIHNNLKRRVEKKGKYHDNDGKRKSSFQSKYLFRFNFRISNSFHENFFFFPSFFLLRAEYHWNQMGVWYINAGISSIFVATLDFLTFYKFYSTHYVCIKMYLWHTKSSFSFDHSRMEFIFSVCMSFINFFLLFVVIQKKWCEFQFQ